jgi:flagellar protein FlgJ
MIPSQPSTYTDFSDLSALRREASSGDKEHALEKAAQQFEALFLQMMLKSMRDAGGGEGLLDNDQTRLYQDMFDKELSLSLSRAENGIGLAKMMIQQIQAAMPGSQSESAQPDSAQAVQAGFAVPARGLHSFQLDPAGPQAEASASTGDKAAKTGQALPPFDSPEQFVASMWPHAQRAADKLGVDPRAVLAQAALETGWGRAVIQHPDGSSSHNLFNIKADHRWDGERVSKMTLEYRDGVAAKEQAWFRSYDSWQESFEDYVRFLQQNGRYQQALESGPDIALFSERLQQAGYATDPAYASKIQRIAEGEYINAGLGGLKNPHGETLS